MTQPTVVTSCMQCLSCSAWPFLLWSLQFIFNYHHKPPPGRQWNKYCFCSLMKRYLYICDVSHLCYEFENCIMERNMTSCGDRNFCLCNYKGETKYFLCQSAISQFHPPLPSYTAHPCHGHHLLPEIYRVISGGGHVRTDV